MVSSKPYQALAQPLAVAGAPTSNQAASPGGQAEPATRQTDTRVEGAPLTWQPGWSKVNGIDYGVLIGSAAIAVSSLVIGPLQDSPVQSRVALDERVRDRLRARTARGKVWARDTSDVLVGFVASYPVAVDGIANAAWYRRSPEVATQMAWMDLEAFALGGAISAIFKVAVSRERPYGRHCGNELNAESNDCLSDDRSYSHFSGHASASFTAASLTCVHHHYLPLWGTTPPWVPCAVGYSLAVVTSGLRIVADMHYFSDVVVGASSGMAAGLLVPWLHYRSGQSRAARWLADHHVTVVPTPNSLTASGVF